MTTMGPAEMAKTIGEGLLSFPVTHFSDDFKFQAKAYQEHIAWLLSYKPAGLFAAGGTGEFFSLTLNEFSAVVQAAVAQTARQVPVLAGCGYGTAMAREFAQAAEAAGADGNPAFAALPGECRASGAIGARRGGMRLDQTRCRHVQPRQCCPRRSISRSPLSKVPEPGGL